MAKRQKRSDSDPQSPELSLPVSLSITDNETYYEPYTPAPNSANNVTPVSPASKKKKRAAAPGPIDDVTVEQNKARRRRYDSFIRNLIQNSGDRTLALSLTYGVESEAIRERFDDYLTDVMLGMNTSSVSDMLEQAALGKAARVGLLANHAYSPDPKVSLVAVKLAADLDGDKHDHGTPYETYLRMVMGKK